jgi:hypothetical protein
MQYGVYTVPSCEVKLLITFQSMDIACGTWSGRNVYWLEGNRIHFHDIQA